MREHYLMEDETLYLLFFLQTISPNLNLNIFGEISGFLFPCELP